MSACSRCGISFHPELARCPLCGTMRERERARRNKLIFWTNTGAVSLVALVVLGRVLSGEAQVGMSYQHCEMAKDLAVQTRVLVGQLENNPAAADELLGVSTSWGELAEQYTPGKYSWSSSGLEHNWLQRLSVSASDLAAGNSVQIEGEVSPDQYVIELTRLLPRYCS